MTIESLTETLVEQHQEEVIKSKLYTLKHSVNPIVAAASPLMSLINRLNSISQHKPQPPTWHSACRHEFLVFRNVCQHNHFSQQTIILSQWFLFQWLCQTNAWNYQDDIPLPELSKPFVGQDNLIQKTLETLLNQHPNEVEVLEFIYILCRLGLSTSDNKIEQEHHIQQLYYITQQKQQTKSKAIRQSETKVNIKESISQVKKNRQQEIAFMLLSFIICLIHSYLLLLIGLQHLQLIFLTMIHQ